MRNSVLANRIVTEVYHLEEDYENVIKVAEDGLEVTNREEQDRGIKIPQYVCPLVIRTYADINSHYRVKLAFNVLLANALVHFFPPKHHARARRIVDEVLAEDPDNIRSLLDRGYILQSAKKWSEASDAFARVAELLPEDLDDGLRAKEELTWSKAQIADPDSGAKGLKAVLEILDTLEGREYDQARCWWRLGQCHWTMEGMHLLSRHVTSSCPLYAHVVPHRSWKPRRSIQVLHHILEALVYLCPRLHFAWHLLR